MDYFLGNAPEGEVAVLTDSEMHHCLKVLRHSVGDEIGITDGMGNLWICQILEDNRNSNQMKAKVLKHEWMHRERKHDLTLICCGPEDPSRMEWLIEKGVELGVTRFLITRSQRSGFIKLKESRLNTLIRTALKQCGRTKLPDYTFFESLPDCLKETSELSGLKILGNASGLPIKQLDSEAQNQAVFVICGPEGDFSAQEYELLAKNNFVGVCLGKTRLRSETASVALLVWVISQSES
jgi:16S rRNA (uracil1498-N3)-methyltransferase